MEIVLTIIGTLAVVWVYHRTPLYDPGSAIWHTNDEELERIALRIFRRFVTRLCIDIGDDAVSRRLFLGVMDIVNRTRDLELRMRLSSVSSARAIKKHNPLKAATQIAAEYNQGLEPGDEIAHVILNPDPNLPVGYMMFVIVEDQGWMYVVRRHGFWMMLAQKRRARQAT